MQQLIVPIDGSHESWRGAEVAFALAARCDATVDVVEVVVSLDSADQARHQLESGIRRIGPGDVEVTPHVLRVEESVAATLGRLWNERPAATFVMSSHGRGRSAAVLGSVVEDLLQREHGPIVVVGPHVERFDFTGRLLVSVDGSKLSETALPLGVAWGIELGMVPWIVEAVEPDTVVPADVAETAYTARLAQRFAAESGHEVEYDVVHGKHPARAISDHAARNDVGLIVATTHGRAGLARLTVGSTAADIVRHATCPVLLHRPPVLAGDAAPT